MKGLKQRNTKGFTLIELMIVVAIIAILAAIALPAYQDYTKRSYVSEGLSLASGAKASVAEYFMNQGAFPTSNSDAGIAASGTIIGNAVTGVTVGSAGKITVSFNAKVNGSSGSGTLILTPKDNGGSLVWSCTDSTLDPKYLPSNCR